MFKVGPGYGLPMKGNNPMDTTSDPSNVFKVNPFLSISAFVQ